MTGRKEEQILEAKLAWDGLVFSFSCWVELSCGSGKWLVCVNHPLEDPLLSTSLVPGARQGLCLLLGASHRHWKSLRLNTCSITYGSKCRKPSVSESARQELLGPRGTVVGSVKWSGWSSESHQDSSKLESPCDPPCLVLEMDARGLKTGPRKDTWMFIKNAAVLITITQR